ncbi:TatD family hydrolase [Rhodoferax saidenbachensis]|uniref:TatD DNase family protein n=1 Tax=Rhodoferax saidenbachensis TaxID=1484693 RepID=A0ABU1ZR63_9BURK|nr:TatD family hydrolase [Rhodoferax saidenbachensis]MDR7308044.1 TatD DNase family protein [Rhodoferax saidenbachensis]
MRWIDTHCHLDAFVTGQELDAVQQRARQADVVHCVIPAVEVANLDTVRELAHAGGHSYGLGIHPLYTPTAQDDALAVLAQRLQAHHADPRLVALGEIGLDYFVPQLTQSPWREKQEAVYRAQLKLARQFDLPVVVHVRRSADRLLKHLRELAGPGGRWQGIAHAFNGSDVQAQEFIKLGFKLGFGGAVTFERAHQLRHLAQTLPLDALVLETDAPDIPPHWLYTTAAERGAGVPQGRNTPAELPRIAQSMAELRGMPLAELADATTHNACKALPKLAALLV